VQAFSAGPDQGSEIVIRLPIMKEPPPVAAVPPAPPTNAPIPPRRVLVVDDNRDIAETMAMVLEFCGHDVRTANSGAAALEVVRTFTPHLALLDIGLPHMNGHELAEHLRRQPALKHVMLVALTGYGLDDDRQRSHEAGFNAHLVKPVGMNDLEPLLAQVTEVA
jgi:two-component system CheB/CheR fusion protein